MSGEMTSEDVAASWRFLSMGGDPDDWDDLDPELKQAYYFSPIEDARTRTARRLS
ncbi:hypothetical protein BJD55_gp028 [Gordonia phage Yvonnetastic]|uniref:Uncharacterized protein n=1 Tax=Gordonia phage Yvonnetastic TaxID=1821566 RepID=A0A142K9F5_9CAUD|nr:hypothetical protein BJD55_gp028 [Gordonia phage Yvonnetastic]AMS02738.1 hypothetical protein SEA_YVONNETASTIC_194 [Gordonia phage Yvonnetastic]